MTFEEWWYKFTDQYGVDPEDKSLYESCWDAAEDSGWRDGNAEGFQYGFDQGSSK